MSKTAGISRRRLLQTAGTAAVAGTLPPLIAPRRAAARTKQLKILQWKHFVAGYDLWFNDVFIRKWAEENQVDVIVDHVGLGDLGRMAAEESTARAGHDLVQFIAPPAVHEADLIDHLEIYQECHARYGKVADFALKSTYNPATDKYFGVCHAYGPSLISYRKTLWDSVNSTPDTWTDVLAGGRRIKLLHEKGVGISLAPEHNGEHALRAVLYSFGASEQDADGRPALNSPATLEAVGYVKSLYEDAMSEEVLRWDAASNNRFMLNGEGSLTLDTISIPRGSEKLGESAADDLLIAAAPAGPTARLAPAFGFYTSAIWNFAENIDTAKQFLVDYMAHLRDGFLASEFQNLPTVAAAVPDLDAVLAADEAGKYEVLAQGHSWTTNLGYPGYTNAAIVEVLQAGTISRMFARVATGELTPESSLAAADGELGVIFRKWREAGML